MGDVERPSREAWGAESRALGSELWPPSVERIGEGVPWEELRWECPGGCGHLHNGPESQNQRCRRCIGEPTRVDLRRIIRKRDAENERLKAALENCAGTLCTGGDVGCAGGGGCKGCDTGEAQCAAQAQLEALRDPSLEGVVQVRLRKRPVKAQPEARG